MKTFLALVATLCLFTSTASAQPRRPPVIIQRPVIVNGPVFFPPYTRPMFLPPVAVPPPYVQPFLWPYPPRPAFGFQQSFRFNQFGFQYRSFGWSGWTW